MAKSHQLGLTIRITNQDSIDSLLEALEIMRNLAATSPVAQEAVDKMEYALSQLLPEEKPDDGTR
jgi:hypothetical protein